jgi:beta-galactosidase
VVYKNGKPWAEDTVRTTGAPTALAIKADRSALRADGSDLAFITVKISDQDGLTVPRTNNAVMFSVSGPADLIATDNGDATSLVSFQSPQRAAFNGLVLAIVRTRPGQGGRIVVKASSEGLSSAAVTIDSAP